MFYTIIFTLLLLSALIWILFKKISDLDCDLTLLFWCKYGKQPDHLRNKIVWITGASSGIGEALAHRLASVGAKLVLSGRNLENLNKVKTKCLEINENLTENDVFISQFDINDINIHSLVFEKVIKHFHQIDVLINNAGRNLISPFEEIDIEVDKELFNTNVFGPLNLTRILLRHWYKTKFSGHLVIHSSIVGKVSYPFSSTYNASKFSLHGYYEALRVEAYSRGIRITMLCPGAIQSNAIVNSYNGKLGEVYGKDLGNPDERMPADRCAHLMLVAIANKCEEVWISYNPILAVAYAGIYLPSSFRYFVSRYLPASILDDIKEGK